MMRRKLLIEDIGTHFKMVCVVHPENNNRSDAEAQRNFGFTLQLCVAVVIYMCNVYGYKSLTLYLFKNVTTIKDRLILCRWDLLLCSHLIFAVRVWWFCRRCFRGTWV